MVFGQKDAVTKALDARDGAMQSLLTNGPMMDAMRSVDSEPLWSILDGKGTQTMMKQILGEAGKNELHLGAPCRTCLQVLDRNGSGHHRRLRECRLQDGPYS